MTSQAITQFMYQYMNKGVCGAYMSGCRYLYNRSASSTCLHNVDTADESTSPSAEFNTYRARELASHQLVNMSAHPEEY